MMNINEILKLDERALRDAGRYPKKRELFSTIARHRGRHFVGIAGPRGVGKTVLLKQLRATTERSVYISLDAVEPENLYELVEALYETYRFSLYLLDEIHYSKNFEQNLKKIFDFLDVRMIFTSSISISLFDSAHDLSRRVRLRKLCPFSFREYLYFRKDIELPRLTFGDIVEKKWRPEHLRQSYMFDSYLQGGIFPFALEEPEPLDLLGNIVKKIVRRDIPYASNLSLDELGDIERLLRFVGRSSVGGINPTSISRNIGTSRYKAEAYLGLLEKAFVLKIVMPRGVNVMKEPKVLMSVPFRLLYQEYEDAIGGLREDFFAEVMTMLDLDFRYLKSTRGAKTPDFIVEIEGSEIIMEIGGKGKGRSQFKGSDREKALILTHDIRSDGIRRPLFLLGFT